jgi:hypothetical protein
MNTLIPRVGLAVLGCVATLLWWTYHDKGSTVQSSSHIPTKVAEGGNQMEVSVEASTASTMRIDFNDLRKRSGQQMLLQSWEKIPAGSHSWTIEVPSGVGGYIELTADHPEPGATLTQRVSINGKETFRETDRLDSPLEPNTAFFVQAYYQDYSKASADPDEPSPE